MDRLEKMKVVIGSTQKQFYGGEEQARLLARGLRDRGHECLLFARRGGIFAQRMEAEGFSVIAFPGNGRSPGALWLLRRHLQQIRPDLLHYNDPHAVTSLGLASWGLRIPARVAARQVAFPLRSTVHYRWFCDRVLCISSYTAQVCRAGGLPDKLLRIVHSGVDPHRAASGDRQRGRSSLGLTESQTLLLCVGKHTACKGHDVLLKALPKVFSAYPRIIMAFAGDGEELHNLQSQSQRLGIGGQVRFLGYRNDVPDLVAAADLFVFPSLQEGLPLSLVDAMLAGVPIVTTTAGGIPDATGSHDAENNLCAWTVEPGNSQALIEAILQALSMPETVALYRDRAKRRAHAMFTADHMVEATLDVYREILKGHAHKKNIPQDRLYL